MGNVHCGNLGIRDVDLCRVSIAVAIVSTVAFKNWSFIVYATQALMILMILSKWSKHPEQRKTGVAWYMVCYGFFSFWCLISSFWAIAPERAVSASVGVIQFSILGLFLNLYLSIEDDSKFVLNCLSWAGVVLLGVLALLTPASLWMQAAQATLDAATDQNRIGTTVGYHPNALGQVCAICAVLWLYRYDASQKKARYLFPAAAFIGVILFTKSRLSIVVMVVAIIVYWLLSTRGSAKKIATILVIGLCVFLGLWAMFSIPALYDLVGFRFASMFGMTSAVDASTTTRKNMIDIALHLFLLRPFTGVGFANYAVYYFYDFSGWAMTYAHSNYAELLADLGIPGVVAYYSIPLWTLFFLAKTSKETTDKSIRYIYMTLMLVLLVADYSTISYTNDFVQLLWASAFGFCLTVKNSARYQKSGSMKVSKDLHLRVASNG